MRLGGAALDQYGEVMLFEGTVAENIVRLDLEPDAEAVVAAAMDGLGVEKSQRWMAERIWGEVRVDAEWSSKSWMRA